MTQPDSRQEIFIASQHALLIAFPHISGEEQIAALLAYPKVSTILLSLCELLRDVDSQTYEAALEKAYADGDVINQVRLMAFGEYTTTVLSDRAKSIVGELTQTTHDLVRPCALALVERLGDQSLLKIVSDSEWSARTLDRTSARLEIWFGSRVLILAAAKGLISAEECADRIDFCAYSSFAHTLGDAAVTILASRIDISLQKAINFNQPAAVPIIERSLDESQRPSLYHAKHRPDPNESDHERFMRATETGEAWYVRQTRTQKAAELFEQELTAAGAQLIMHSATPELVALIYASEPRIVIRWLDELLSLGRDALARVHNFALAVAKTIASNDPVRAVALFKVLESSDPIVRIKVGKAQVDFDSVAIWSAPDSKEITELRVSRLDRARNDHEFAMEVLAAIGVGKIDAIRDYVEERRASAEPSNIARAIMVAGLSDDAPWALETLHRHKDDFGFLGEAHRAAKYAMERLQWSKHWAKKMATASTEIDYWRYGVLLTTIVDGRLRWDETSSPSFDRFNPPFEGLFRQRVTKWKNKREKTLFGGKPPNEIFLV